MTRCSRCGSPDVREFERVAGIEGEAVRYTVLGCVDCGFVAEAGWAVPCTVCAETIYGPVLDHLGDDGGPFHVGCTS